MGPEVTMNIYAAKKDGLEWMSLDDFEEMLPDKPAHEKWELINGRVIRGMVGARWEHHVIIDNMGLAISNHFLNKKMSCRVYRETFFLKERKQDLAALPDLMIRCGKPAPGATSFNDPLILVEVVSPGSEARDRLEKRVAYQQLPSLQTYVLVTRDQPFVEVFERSAMGFVATSPLTALDAVLKLPAIDFAMPLSAIYRDVPDTPSIATIP
jgi:Uma2 family endonuclease